MIKIGLHLPKLSVGLYSTHLYTVLKRLNISSFLHYI